MKIVEPPKATLPDIWAGQCMKCGCKIEADVSEVFPSKRTDVPVEWRGYMAVNCPSSACAPTPESVPVEISVRRKHSF